MITTRHAVGVGGPLHFPLINRSPGAIGRSEMSFRAKLVG